MVFGLVQLFKESDQTRAQSVPINSLDFEPLSTKTEPLALFLTGRARLSVVPS
jgi:hypothetical protein